jgi:hypothetical protein
MRIANLGVSIFRYCTSDLCRPRGRVRPTSASCDRHAFAPAVAPALTSLVLDASAATCLTRKTIRLFVVLSADVRVVLLNAMTPAAIAPGANPIFHLMMPHLNAAVSSRIYPDEHRSTRGLDSRVSTPCCMESRPSWNSKASPRPPRRGSSSAQQTAHPARSYAG